MPGAHVALAAGLGLDRPLADEVEQHGDVVRAEAPERVLVGAHLAEVLAVAVEVVDVAELARVDQRRARAERRVEEQQVPDHEPAVGRSAAATSSRASATLAASGFSMKHVLARLERAQPRAWCVVTGVAMAIASSSGSASRSSRSAVKRVPRVQRPVARAVLLGEVAAPGAGRRRGAKLRARFGPQ